MEHHFDIEIATKHGMDVAVFLNNISFWIQKNIANNKHYYDGNYWTYNSIEAFQKIFPYFSIRAIRRIIDYCVKNDLILKGNYNENSHDRTCWYALTEKGLNLFKPLSELICQKRQMDLSRMTNGVVKTDKCIKETDNKPYNKTERACAPLSPIFKPDEKNKKLLQIKSKESGLSQKVLMDKFYAIHRGRKMKDAQASLELFLLRERPKEKINLKACEKPVVRSKVQDWGPGHPTWEEMNKK